SEFSGDVARTPVTYSCPFETRRLGRSRVVSGHGQVVARRLLQGQATRQPRVQLTPRDLSILRDVVRFGALTVDQIGRRHFGSVLTAYGRLKALVDAGYLRGERVFYHRPAAYVGTRAGAQAAGTN